MKKDRKEESQVEPPEKLLVWQNQKGFSMELKPVQKGETLRRISYGKGRLGLTILQIESHISDNWPVVTVPTLEELQKFHESILDTKFDSVELKTVQINAKIDIVAAIINLQNE